MNSINVIPISELIYFTPGIIKHKALNFILNKENIADYNFNLPFSKKRS